MSHLNVGRLRQRAFTIDSIKSDHSIRETASIKVGEKVKNFVLNPGLHSANCNVIEEKIENLVLADFFRAKERKYVHCYAE